MDGASAEGATDSNDTQFWLEPGEGTPEAILANPLVREVYLGEQFSL